LEHQSPHLVAVAVVVYLVDLVDLVDLVVVVEVDLSLDLLDQVLAIHIPVLHQENHPQMVGVTMVVLEADMVEEAVVPVVLDMQEMTLNLQKKV